MVTMKCVKKFEIKGKKHYVLADGRGRLETIASEQLKRALKNEEINVTNLKLTANNRIIEKKEQQQVGVNSASRIESVNSIVYIDRDCVYNVQKEKELYFKSHANIDSIRTKASTLGYTLSKFRDSLYVLENNNTIGIISDKQLSLTEDCTDLFRSTSYKSIKFRNINSANIKNTSNMFDHCSAQELDLNDLDTSKVTTMQAMFTNCKAERIALDKLDTSNVKDMSFMFYASYTKELDLSNFNTKRVKDMEHMFCLSKATKLNVSSFDTSNVENMSDMFYSTKVQNLDLSNFNTRKVTDMGHMFSFGNLEELNISSFDISNVKTMTYMFYLFQCPLLDISSFDLNLMSSGKINVYSIFRDCKTRIIGTNQQIINELLQLSKVG